METHQKKERKFVKEMRKNEGDSQYTQKQPGPFTSHGEHWQ